ncbi:hypothetical protein JL720_15031 [Aureococcus anophagefferens]|nr:hypothetical protein JL720_15031 [Aureococcus anophagefferens]
MGETQARSTMARVAGLSLLVAIPGAFLASRSQAPLGGSALLSSASSPWASRTAEREKLFDAFKTLMTVDTAAGLESYGINYRSLDYFTENT